MSLISITNLLAYADRCANVQALRRPIDGTSVGSVVAGTVRNAVNNLLTDLVTNLNDYEQELDLVGSQAVASALTKSPVEASMLFLASTLSQLNDHCNLRGRSVDSTILDLATYLTYYNGGSGGVKFANMVTKDFADVWKNIVRTTLPYPAVMFEPVTSLFDSSTYASGLGKKTVGGAFTAGFAIDNTLYAEQKGLAVVTTDISGGAGAILITVAGTDDTGVTTTTWSATITGGNNPAAALSQQTVSSGAILAQARATVTVGSTTGIVPGSVLRVNSGLPDEEKIIVEAVPGGTTLTAVFQKAHAVSATLDGNTTTALTPSVAGRRIRSVSGITYTVNAHSAGVVQICGAPDRVGV